MIRISVLKETLDEVELKIEGQLVGVDTKVLEEEGTHWLARKGRLVLDLSDLQHIDRQGIALLKGWENESLVVRGASEFVQALMVRHGLNLVNNEGRDRDSVKGLL